VTEEPHPAEGYPHKEAESAFPAYWGELMWAMSRFQESGYLEGRPSVSTPSPAPGSPALFYPELTKRFVELIMPKLEIKQILQDFFIRVGATATIPKQQGAGANALIGRTADGNGVMMDFKPYDLITITPYKIGMRVRLAREMLEDGIYTIVEDQFRRAATHTANAIDNDIAKVFEAASKKSFSWLPHRYPHLDNVIKNLDDVGKYNVLMNDKKYSYGVKMSGIKALRSPMINPKAAYVVQTAFDGCYAPVGYFVTKRPISIDVWPQPQFDSLDVVITARYAPVITYPEAITRCRV
jgi:Holliday junction resolvase RusA-like endonuclease